VAINGMTLSQLQTAVLQRADMLTASGVSSNYISSSELTSYINQSYFEYYDLITDKFGNDYYAAPPTQFTTNGTSQLYSLPDGVTSFTNGVSGGSFVPPPFFKLLGVDLSLSTTNDSFVTLRPFNFSDRNRYAVPNFQSFYGVTNLRYRIIGSNPQQIWFTPIPSQGQTMQILYIPQMTQLSASGDQIFDPAGWGEYIVNDAAIKCLIKEESDVSVLMARKQALITRIEAAAENRDAGSPATVNDSQYSDFWWPTGSGSGYGSGAF